MKTPLIKIKPYGVLSRNWASERLSWQSYKSLYVRWVPVICFLQRNWIVSCHHIKKLLLMINHCVNFGILKGVQKNKVIAGTQVPLFSYTWAAGKEIFRNIVGYAHCFVLAVGNIYPQIQENHLPKCIFTLNQTVIKMYYVCVHICVCVEWSNLYQQQWQLNSN